jgi:hypothetical protein
LLIFMRSGGDLFGRAGHFNDHPRRLTSMSGRILAVAQRLLRLAVAADGWRWRQQLFSGGYGRPVFLKVAAPRRWRL